MGTSAADLASLYDGDRTRILIGGVEHGYEVLGDEPARVVCVDSPKRPPPD